MKRYASYATGDDERCAKAMLIRTTPQLHKAINEKAAEKNISVSLLIKLVMEQYLKTTS